MFERFTHAAFLGVRRFKNDITKGQGGRGGYRRSNRGRTMTKEGGVHPSQNRLLYIKIVI